MTKAALRVLTGFTMYISWCLACLEAGVTVRITPFAGIQDFERLLRTNRSGQAQRMSINSI
jgi:hypothetical protein